MKNRENGYTLIEILISVAVLAAILVVTVGAMLNSLTASRKIAMSSKVENNGNWVASELRKNLLRASNPTVICPVGVGTSISFLSGLDGEMTSLVCEEGGKIASISGALRVNLTEDGVMALGCENFVGCSLPPTVNYPVIGFNFSLTVGVTNSGATEATTRSFSSKVVVRN